MFADLHLHSIYSDGLYTPDEICRRAKARGLSLLSITDHDTLAGEEDKRAAAKKHGLSYVTGWEISAFLGEVKIHITGYGCRQGEAYRRFMEESKQNSYLRVCENIKSLQEQGLDITIEEALAERADADLPVHVMHLARALGKKLGVDESAAYKQYLSYGKPAYSNFGRTTPKQAIDCILESGGFAAVAHPGRILLPFEERERAIKEMVELGASGIESYYTTHTEKETAYFNRLAKEWGLCVTGGSDTHYEEAQRGTNAPRIGVPRFTPDEALLEKLRAHGGIFEP